MKNTKEIFKGRLLRLVVQRKRLPNGYVGTFETIQHRGATLVIPFLTKSKIIMLRQLRPVIGKYIYELPAGTLDAGENPISCAKREIIEETGYSAKKLTRLGMIYPVPGYSTERIIIYKAEGLKKGQHIPEDDEIIESRIFTKRQIKILFKRGALTDAKTIAALAMCGWL